MADVTYECTLDPADPLNVIRVVRKVGPLSQAEQRAWLRWHRGVRVHEVLAHKAAHGRFPVFQGGS